MGCRFLDRKSYLYVFKVEVSFICCREIYITFSHSEFEYITNKLPFLSRGILDVER
jgi:hypothetical protein